MRLSSQRHPLAVLRVIIGLTQKEMATILECSTPTIQAIELGKLKISEKLAGITSLKTGINLKWLLDDDVTKPPVDVGGSPYNRERFEDFQAMALQQKHNFLGGMQASMTFITSVKRLADLTLHAYINDDTAIYSYKLAKAFEELEKQFRGNKTGTEITESVRNSGDLLKDFSAALRRECKKKGEENPMKITIYGKMETRPDGHVAYTPQRLHQKNTPIKNPTRKLG